MPVDCGGAPKPAGLWATFQPSRRLTGCVSNEWDSHNLTLNRKALGERDKVGDWSQEGDFGADEFWAEDGQLFEQLQCLGMQ